MKLFDRLFARAIDRRVAEYQSDLIARHCEEVQNSYKTMRGWRHDYHNHIQTLLALCGDEEKTRRYLLDLSDELKTVDTVIKTGNVMLDAILGSKLSLIKAKLIAVNAKAVVPEKLSVSELDLCNVVGNLLDNAAESCAGSDKPWIRVFIGALKDNLYISVSNSAVGTPTRSGKTYVSKKGEGHGFGISRINKIAEKYNGYTNFRSEEGVFAAEVMLPL